MTPEEEALRTLDISKFPPIYDMIERLVPPLTLIGEVFTKRKIARIAKKQAYTKMDYIHVCIYYNLFVLHGLYSAENDIPFKNQRQWIREETTYVIGDFKLNKIMGRDTVWYKDQMIINTLRHEDSLKFIFALSESFTVLRKIFKSGE